MIDTKSLERQVAELEDTSMLVLDDDRPLLTRLGRALEARGFEPVLAETLEQAREALRHHAPAFAVLDMRVGDGNGLDFLNEVKAGREDCRAIMLTGYGNLATAVYATKLGAVDYLAKPADADQIVVALLNTDGAVELPDQFVSADRVRWEHIQRVYELCDRNVSETARRLSMHRRTLQRILAKRAPQ